MQGANHYFENVGGKKFVEKTAEYFPKTSWGAMGVKFFDYDNDGRMDLIVTDMHSDMMTEIGPAEEKEKVTTPAPDAMLGAPAKNFIFGNAFYHNIEPERSGRNGAAACRGTDLYAIQRWQIWLSVTKRPAALFRPG
jgi:hypothetical protein